MNFRQIGLFTDDYLVENETVTKALERLPRDVYHERQFRFSRAIMLNIKRDILPKEEWTTFENDLKYLTPYVEEVKREEHEVHNWNNENVDI
jgi:ubiquinol-cytochrome c reductase subunit 7